MLTDLPIILRGGFGPLRFGASVEQTLIVFGSPTDTDAPGGVTPQSLSTRWPNQFEVEWDYEPLSTIVRLVKTPDRGPCVVAMKTRYRRATLLGLPAFNTPVFTLSKALAAAGVECRGADVFTNTGATWVFTHGLWMHVYEPYVTEISWTVDDRGDGRVDWSLMERTVG